MRAERNAQWSAPAERNVSSEERERAISAQARASVYAVFSGLLRSPFECEVSGSGVTAMLPDNVVSNLPFAFEATGLTREAQALGSNVEALLRSEYARVFEIGDRGPAATLREDVARNHASGAKEEVVRFYDFFGYRPNPDYQWAQDHACVELEFMHVLCHLEAAAQTEEAALSFQLAQLDFLGRHLGDWLPMLRKGVKAAEPHPYYAELFDAVDRFVAADLAWQRSTLVEI